MGGQGSGRTPGRWTEKQMADAKAKRHSKAALLKRLEKPGGLLELFEQYHGSVEPGWNAERALLVITSIEHEKAPLNVAAARAGVHASVVRRHFQQGSLDAERWSETGNPDDLTEDAVFYLFAEQKRSEHQVKIYRELYALADSKQVTPQTAGMLFRMLESIDPDNWERQQKVRIDATSSATVDVHQEVRAVSTQLHISRANGQEWERHFAQGAARTQDALPESPVIDIEASDAPLTLRQIAEAKKALSE